MFERSSGMLLHLCYQKFIWSNYFSLKLVSCVWAVISFDVDSGIFVEGCEGKENGLEGKKFRV